MTDEKKAVYLAELYEVRSSILAGMKSARGTVTRMIDGQSVTYSGAAELMRALRDINSEISAIEGDGNDFGFALAVFS